MKFSEYINWIIQHPGKNFKFAYAIIEPDTINKPIYLITYTNPDTGLSEKVAAWTVENNKLIDSTTRLELANCEDVLLAKFKKLCK